MFFAPGRRKKIIGWVLYDFANTSFSVIVVTVIYAIFFKQYICADAKTVIWGKEIILGDFLWGLAGSLSMLLVALTSPFFGTLADVTPHRKKLLFIYTYVAISSTFLLFFLQPGMILVGILLFIIGNIGFEGGIVFYNSYIPMLVEKKYYGRLSGLGFGVGYLGSLASLLIALPIAMTSIEKADPGYMRYSFPLSALFFLIFSLPLFSWVKDDKANTTYQNLKQSLRTTYLTLLSTLKNLRKYPNVLIFLGAYFLYIDAVNTVIFFGGIYAKETLQFTMVEVIIFFAIIQSTAIVGSFIFGYITDKIGSKKTIFILLIMWIVIVLIGGFATTKALFYLVGLLAGLGTGSIQTTSRTLMTEILPKNHEAEFFGFYALSGKISSILGPGLFGLISAFTGSQRFAVLSLSLFFISGIFILRKLKYEI
ncbi:MAG: MFS transporter [Calditrichia bacterium]